MAHADARDPGVADDAEIRPAPAKGAARVKRPNQKQYNKELADICANIGKLLEEQKALDSKERAAADECRKIRQEKSAEFERKRNLEATLKTANEEVVNKSDCLAKLQINLHYKNESRLDDAIRRLEAQLSSCSWKQSEEKKVVDEIESLRRSKSTLTQYNQLKGELDELKKQVKQTRSTREEVFQSLSALKAKEDHHTRERSDSRARSASVRSELDACFEAKRKLKDDFTQQKGAYNAQKAEEQQRAVDKARLAAEHRKKMQPHTEVIRKYRDKEHQLCSMLLQYLHRLAGSSLDVADDAHAHAPATKEPLHEVEGMKRLDKDASCPDGTTDAGSFVAAASKRKGKKKRRHRLDKLLCHTPEAVSWFIELHLAPPATAADIGRVMEQLTELKAQHETAAVRGMGSEDRSAAASVPAGMPEPQLQSLTTQLAPFACEASVVQGAVEVITSGGDCVQEKLADQVTGSCPDESTLGNCDAEHLERFAGTSHTEATSASPCCCCHCHQAAAADCSAVSTDAAVTAAWSPGAAARTCGACCHEDSAREAEPAAAQLCSVTTVDSFPDWSETPASPASTDLTNAIDVVSALCTYEGKTFIQQSLSLAASSGRDEALSNMTMA